MNQVPSLLKEEEEVEDAGEEVGVELEYTQVKVVVVEDLVEVERKMVVLNLGQFYFFQLGEEVVVEEEGEKEEEEVEYLCEDFGELE